MKQYCLVQNTFSDSENKEKRNSVTTKFTFENFKTLLPRIEKTITDLGLAKDRKYLFGGKVTLADLYCLQLKIFFSDGLYNKEQYQNNI